MMKDMTNEKSMLPYNSIPPVESDFSIEDYIQTLSMFSIEMAGKMKCALESAKTQAFVEGLHVGHEDSASTVPAGFDLPSPETTAGAVL